MNDYGNYKEVEKKVKILRGPYMDKEAAEFEKTHTVIDIKQYTADTMFIFYLEEVK